MLVRLGGIFLLDYFAILPEYRDCGCGSLFLQRLCSDLTGAEIILIESGDPDCAESDAERAVSERRLRFYLRNGCADTGVTARVFGVEYRLLEISRCPHSQDDVRRIYRNIYESFLPEQFRRELCIH